MSRKLFVGGLAWKTTDEDLKRAFEKFGEIIGAAVICDRETGRSRGFGFVTYAEESQAEAALQAMQGAMLDGRALRLDAANEGPQRPRDPRPPIVATRRPPSAPYGGGGDRDSGFRPPMSSAPPPPSLPPVMVPAEAAPWDGEDGRGRDDRRRKEQEKREKRQRSRGGEAEESRSSRRRYMDGDQDEWWDD